MATKSVKIIFVGNSYTYYNKMPHNAFLKLVSAAGLEADVSEITWGGYRLCPFANANDVNGIRLREEIKGKHYDYAVLQEQSLNPIKNEAEFIEGVIGVKKLIDADKFILYATWGRNDGSAELEELGLTREQMTEALSVAYNKAAKLVGADVAEVGKAFLKYTENHNKDDLYDPDKSHPSAIGSQVAARVIFEKILNN
jgi:hypothetical protein